MAVRSLRPEAHGDVEMESLQEQIENSEQEARIVLPGIQALFGFQLVAVFDAKFKDDLPLHLQKLHLAALMCVAVSVVLVLTPAAYHRMAEPGQVSRLLAKIASVFLSLSLIPMMLGIVLDVYVISRFITGSVTTSWILATSLLVAYTLFWFVFPFALRRANR